MIRDLLSFAFVSFSAVFVVVDPFAAVPFFLAMTADDDAAEKRATARRAAIAAGCVLGAFALAGAVVFKVLGISLGAFKIAGGVLLLITAVDMLRSRASETRITAGEVAVGVAKEDVAIVPLAMPLLAGPGAIATVVVLMGRAERPRLLYGGIVLAAVAATAAVAYVVLAGASRVDRVLGKTGLNILERAAGLLLAAIAIQFMIDGVGESLPGLLQRV
ncbi:MAG TPA: MarC family protein [Anaeromyxobacteraceae bacterium]|nr:MarC family protein [Anaeromyxobacteraceae bacterium]